MNTLSVAVDLVGRLLKAQPEVKTWALVEVRNWGCGDHPNPLVAWECHTYDAVYMANA